MTKKKKNKEYDPEKDIEKICEKHQIIFTDPIEYDGIKAVGFLPLVHKELLSFLKQKKPSDYYILYISDPENKEAKFGFKITYQGGEGKINNNVIKISKEKKEEMKIILDTTFEMIKEVLHIYVKLKEEYYDLIAIWIIGTYHMDLFNTYPYLFINAQKGSGKTRLLKLIEALANNGELLASMREAVLFRMASMGKTLLIDELEGLERKENAPLRELLNACYKRGTKVYRMKKKGEDYVLDPFTPFTPIAIANISGTDDVLGDRCIPIRLNKSSKSTFSLIQEDFNNSPKVKEIKENFKKINDFSVEMYNNPRYTIESWNRYINLRYTNTTLHTHTTHTTHTTRNTPNPSSVGSVGKNDEKIFSVGFSVGSDDFSVGSVEEKDVIKVYDKIINSGINGRHLELVFPLLTVALMLNEEIFERLLKFSKELMEKKIEEDVTESTDISLIEFISKMSSEIDYNRYRFVHKLTDDFRYFLGIRKEREQEDINPIWVGRALKRMDLIIERRRLSAGVEVKLNIQKAIKLLENLK